VTKFIYLKKKNQNGIKTLRVTQLASGVQKRITLQW